MVDRTYITPEWRAAIATRMMGNQRSAGMRNAGYKHGMYGSRTHNSWTQMKQRVLNPRCPDYHRYGGRGITICERWEKFENFLEDMGVRPEGMTLDRRDSNGNYEPGNCKWSTPKEQAQNRRCNCGCTHCC